MSATKLATRYCILLMTLSSGLYAKSNLDEVWQAAKQSDTQIATAQLQAEIAEIQIKQGLARLLPTLSASTGYSVSGEDLNLDLAAGDLSAGLSLNQPLYYQNALYFYDGLKEKTKTAPFQLQLAEQNLMMSVTEAYFNALKAEDRVRLSASELYAVQRQLEQTKKRFDVGLIAQTDVLDAQSGYASAKVNLISAQGQRDSSLEQLAILANSPMTLIATLPDPMVVPEHNQLSVAEWIELATARHPSLLLDAQNMRVAELNQLSKQAERLPTVSASLSVNNGDLFDDNSLTNRVTTRLALNVAIPLYDGGARSASIIENGLNMNIALQRTEQTRRNIELSIRQTYRKIQMDEANLEALDQAVAAREGALRSTQAGYEVGTRNIVEVLNAQRATYVAKLNYRMAQYDIILGQLKLRHAAGLLTQADLMAINALLE